MAPLSLKIVLDEGAVTRKLMFDTTTNILQAHRIVREKILTLDPAKDYGFFLTSADNDYTGVWLNENRALEYYMLRDGDSLFYLPKIRNLKVRMLDGTVKTLQVDESQRIEELMVVICEKIGTANHEEYGLCREDTLTDEVTKPSTGTLTLRKRTIQREKDAQLEQMSKKLKTDDNVEWLDQHKTLRELQIDPKETLLFKRRLFYSDRNIDSRDPVQLNLLYVQTRDAILDGRQVVTEDKAVEFAGIQCQVQYGDFQEKKHKPGFIENLKEFLPEQYAGSWGIEKKMNKLHEKHLGLSHVEAKHLYTKTARDLPTYGVTFFLVKEQQKGKKKLVPRLLGINSESILRLDEGTKEILQTWLLTQVKSYSAGKESFTLNFGDYSDKTYVVKTNEAIRIKDILEGYIDIIRKKLAAPFSAIGVEGEAICEDMVESSKGAIIQTVVPSRVVEHCLVGPSQIISVNQGQQSQQGTKIVTVQQIITTMRGDNSQQPMKGEISMRSNMPMEFSKRLNHLNSECVNCVVLLSNPTLENIQKVRRIIDDMEDGLPGIIKGTKEVAANLHGDGSKKLLEELDELCNYINKLAATTKKSDLSNPDNLMTAQDAARKIAELSTQMCFSLDPKTKRRSNLLMRSRKSFIQDEKTEASLRRASFLHAAENALQAVEQAHDTLDEMYDGPSLNDDELKCLEMKAVKRMGKLNAAIALLLNAHADPRNIDYEMAVNSMKTINEIMPKFMQDSKPLTATGDKGAGGTLRNQIRQLLDRTGRICKLTGTLDICTMQDEGDGYADAARKLVYTFNRRKPEGNVTHDEDHKVTTMCEDIEKQVSLILMVANELNALEVNDPRSNDVKAASVKCRDAIRGLLACAKLTGPSIHEPHCQSALRAAVENLASSAQNLTHCCKPLVEKPSRHGMSKQLANDSFALTKALDRLNDAFANLNAPKIEGMDIFDDSNSNVREKNRLKFIVTTAAAKDAIMDADKELKQMMTIPAPTISKINNSNKTEIQSRLSENLAQLNAAIASLLQATSDAENPDYPSAETATKTICKLTPNLIKDTKTIQGTVDKSSWDDIVAHLTDMLEATRSICINAEDNNIQEMNNAANKFANSSGKLVYVFNPRKNPEKEKEIIELSRTALQDTSQMLSHVYLLAETIGGEDGARLDDAGVKVVDAAQQLLRTAEITAPSIADTRCQIPLLTSIESLSQHICTLENFWRPLLQAPEYRQTVDQLNHDMNVVQTGLEKLRKACKDSSGDDIQETKRLKFIATKSAAKNALTNLDKQLDTIIKTPTSKKLKGHIDSKNLNQHNMTDNLARLNAAIAMLMQSNSDKNNPDYDSAEMAISNICDITSGIIKDTEYLHGNTDDNTWKEITEDLKAILEATQEICSKTQENNVKEMNDAATKFAKSSGKLTYVFNPRRNPMKENQISDLSKSAVEQISQVLSHVTELAESVGGEDGNKLDDAGVKIVNFAQQLLKTAEIVAPSITDFRCQTALRSSIYRLSDHLQALEHTWAPLVNPPKHHQIGNKLDHDLKLVQIGLEKLNEACQDADAGDIDPLREIKDGEQQAKKRLKFIATKSAAKKSLTDTQIKLDEFMKTPATKKLQVDIRNENPEIQQHLCEKLGTLNAAIASFIQATSDKNTPDYDNAVMAIDNMSKIASDITKDVECLRDDIDEKSWKDIVGHLKVLLDATQEICTLSEEGDIKEMNDVTSKFAASSGKLIYVFNPYKNPKKEEQISVLSRSAVEQTSRMLSTIYQLAESIGNEDGNKLDDVGVNVVNDAQQLLKTAEITGPSIADAQCQQALQSAIDRLSKSLRNLENTWKPLVQSPEYLHTDNRLNHDLNSIQIVLDKLKDACQCAGADLEKCQKKQQLLFTATALTAKKVMIDAEKELQDLITTPLKTIEKAKVVTLKRSLAQRLARLNSNIASLILATSDGGRLDYNSATRSIHTISHLTPDVIKDVKSIRGAFDQNSLKIIDENLSDVVVTTREICKHVEDNNPEHLKEAAFRCAKSVGRLSYVFTPPTNTVKENKILDLSRSAAEQTSLLLSNVYQLADKIGAEEGKTLNSIRVRVVNASQMLQKTAEILAPTISDAYCQATLVSSVDDLSNLSNELKNIWQPIVQGPQHRQTGDQLEENLKHVQTTLCKLRNICQDNGSSEISMTTQINVQTAKDKIKEAERLFQEDKMAELKANEETCPNVFEQRIQTSHKITSLNEAVALLLQAMLDLESLDIKRVEHSIDVISDLTPAIVKDTIALQLNVDDDSRQILFEEAKALCAASRAICDSVEKRNMEDLNNAATQYAQCSRKLRYIISPRTYPNKEKKILDMVRSACERTSLMLSRVSRLAQCVEREKGIDLDISGAKVANAAQVFLNNAQITASSITEKNCQLVLVSTADTLAKHAQDLKEIWMPLAQRKEHQEFGDQLHRDSRLLLTELKRVQETCQGDTEEAQTEVQQQKCFNTGPKQSQMENIDSVLENIQKNVHRGNTSRNDEVAERLTIEDNPLRQLATKILDSVTTKIKSKNISPNEQKELVTFSKELQAAVNSLDITNAKCRKEPLDSNRRQDLENAIMNLQQICLLSRRKNGDQNNIVDLADYINDMTASVDDLSKTAAAIKTERGNEATTDIKNTCDKIQIKAGKLLTLEAQADGNIVDDMLQINHFAQDCDNHLKSLTLAVQKINDENSRNILQDKLQYVAECCDLLRFATKSSISSATSATIDEGLQNLKDVEKQIEIILKPAEDHGTEVDHMVIKPAIEAAQTAFATVVAAENENALPKSLVRYTAQMRGIGVTDQKYKLKEHLQRLLDLLKLKAVTSSRLLATWQDVNGPETIAATENVLQELKSFAEQIEKSNNYEQKGTPSQVQIIKDNDIKSLLIPNKFTVTGDEKELNVKLYQQIQKLNSISGTIALSLYKPESLSRTLHTLSESARQLAGIARGLKSEDPIQNKRIEEAVQEMNIATYNVMKTSESSCQSSNRVGSRRRLLESCRLLNEALNKLARASSPGNKVRNDCDEMNRNLQLQQTFLQTDAPACALSYADCLDALNNQNDVIQKLRSEEPIMRSDVNTSLRYITSAVCNCAEFAAQTAYLLSLTDENQTAAKQGLIDLPRLHKVAESTEDTCLQIICSGSGEQATEFKAALTKQVQQLQEAIDDAHEKVKDDNKHPLIVNSNELKTAMRTLHSGIPLTAIKEEDFTLKIMRHIDAIKKINAIIKKVPQPEVDKDTKKANMSMEVIDNTKSLITSTSMMVKKASLSEEETMSWTMFGGSDVIKAFEALITCIREQGAQAGLIESLKSLEEQDVSAKSLLKKEVDLASYWLQRPASKERDKVAGVKAAQHVVDLAEQVYEDLHDVEKEEMNQMIVETKQLLNDCTVKYNSNKASLLLERLKELRLMLEKGVVTRVVEDFLTDLPLDNLEKLVHTEEDARKRKFLLDKKIAELLVQLGRVKRTAGFVADTGNAPRLELITATDQVELLAPALVKAAQHRVEHPNDQGSRKDYEELLHEYAQTLSRVRELCDQAVDPIDFAQAAGETMHRIKEESAITNDPHKSAHTSSIILKLGNRVVKAGMKSSLVRKDPELKETLAKIDAIVTAKYADVKRADWRDVMAEIMKKTGEVESALGGENIFLKQAEPDQPIFAAALNLHAAVRDWSARDNEIVAVAKRMAVLMARLSDYMNTENKRELLHTSKSIVSESREVASLAKKLALECSDIRIRTNLLQVCEQIPTISGQLKMLTTIKGASFGQGNKEDKEAMNMLVGNAQNLMISIQDVVKAAASASVKIMSQRGRRMKWVRRNYY